MTARRQLSDVCCLCREPTEDERRGIAWWNALSHRDRAAWLANAAIAMGRMDVSAADAWAIYKAEVRS